jgi:hypothetical protein
MIILTQDSSSLLIPEVTSHPALHYAPCTKAYREVDVQLHAFLNLSTIWGQLISFKSWLVHTCQSSMHYLLNRKLGGPHRQPGCTELKPNFLVVQPIPRCYTKWEASITYFHIFPTTPFRVSLQNDNDLIYNALHSANMLHIVHAYGKTPRNSFYIYLGNKDIYRIVKTDA